MTMRLAADSPELSNDDYLTIQQSILVMGSLIVELDLPAFIERIARAEAMAPLIDPTLFMRGAPNLQVIRSLATSLMEFREEAIKARDGKEPA